MNFADRVVLVTGAARGLGHATAQAFHREGAAVAINDRTAEAVDAAIAALGGGDRLRAAPGDLSTVEGCAAAVAAATGWRGRLDVLVNNAAVNIEQPIERTDETLWDAHLDVILKGSFFCVRAGLDALRRSRGCVVNVASELGLQPMRDNVAYCAAKGGLVNLTRALAVELAPEVRVNCVSPGAIDTPLMAECAAASGDPAAYYAHYAKYAPLKRMAAPEEIAATILFLASPAASFITGAILAADGGSTAGR